MSRNYNISIVGSAFNWLILTNDEVSDVDINDYLEGANYSVSNYSDLDQMIFEYYETIQDTVFDYEGKLLSIKYEPVMSGASRYNRYFFTPYVDTEDKVDTIIPNTTDDIANIITALTSEPQPIQPSDMQSVRLPVREFVEANMGIPAYQLTYLINREYGTNYHATSIVSMKSAITKKRNRNR